MNKITYADIMNICAAFELQFDVSVRHNYKYKEQEKVKKKIIKIIENSRETEFSDSEKIYFDEIIEGMKNVEYKFERNMYWDAELLRAMVYMLILKTAGVSDKNKLFNTLKKLSKYPI